MDAQTRKNFCKQLCAGVQCLHDNEISHRDLSLENVFVTADNVLKIGDFGQASTEHFDFCFSGKKAYRAPEVYNLGTQYDTRLADIFSLGVCMFCVLTGHTNLLVPPNTRVIE